MRWRPGEAGPEPEIAQRLPARPPGRRAEAAEGVKASPSWVAGRISDPSEVRESCPESRTTAGSHEAARPDER